MLTRQLTKQCIYPNQEKFSIHSDIEIEESNSQIQELQYEYIRNIHNIITNLNNAYIISLKL